MLFFFSGTGNSLYAARAIADGIGDEDVRSIPQEMRKEPREYADERIGIVSPVYGHDLPAMVKEFISTSIFETRYFYFVLTYGNRRGNVVQLACDHAHEADIDVAYATTLLMVDNWLPGYDVAEQLRMDKHIDENIGYITDDIKNKVRKIDEVTVADRAAHEEFLAHGVSFTPKGMEGFLSFTDACTGCGNCIEICPAGCIRMEDGRAVHDALSGLGCNTCLACVHVCPAHAIEMALGDKNPTARFRNEHVLFADLCKANGHD